MKVRALIIVAVMLAFAGSAWAVTPVNCSDVGVNLVPLNSFTAWGGFRPVDVAVSPSGKVYVTDDLNDKVTIFSREGKALKSIAKTNPNGIAVDNAGDVFIGTTKGERGYFTGEVDVYDEALNFKGALGKGWGEFTFPSSIAADDSRIFVADANSNSVKVYDKQTRQLLTAFGGFGTADGSLVMPSGVSVTSDGTIYVSDLALQYDSQSGSGIGAGAHIFTINADNQVTFVKKFASFGFEDQGGLFISTGGITFDGSGLVMVSDSARGDVQVFDSAGNYACSQDITAFTMFPKGLEVSGEGKLMVAAHDRVYRFGIGQYSDITVSPTILQINEQACGDAPSAQNITITNNGQGPVDWSASESVSWLSLSSTSGTVAAAGAETVSISVDASGLSIGSSNIGIIKITAPGVSENVMVALTVSGPPSFGAAPTSFSFTVVGTDIPESGQLTVDGTGWTSTSPAWISLSPGSSSGALTVASVGVNASALDGMDGGEYAGVITLDTGCSLIAPVDIAVSLTYVKGGSIAVTTNNASAEFTISGPESYSGTGTSFQADGVPEGTYTVSFSAVTGFKTPGAVQVQVVNGQTATANAEYIDLRESNAIILSKALFPSRDSNDVAVYEGDGTLAGTFVIDTSDGMPSPHGKVPTTTVAGDFDGDGVDEIAVAHDNGVITGYEADGTPISGFEFMAFQDNENVDLASGDFDGDGRDELIVGAGTARKTDAAVRIFSYANGLIRDLGVYFLASSDRNGVEVAAGDINGDGVDELLTVTNDGVTASVRVWSINAPDWTVVDAGGFSMASGDALDMALGDMNADGVDEIVITSGGKEGTSVAIYDTSGNSLGGFAVPGMPAAFVAAGDTDSDGAAEIVISCACDRTPEVIVYRSDGTVLSEFKAFENTDTKGARVSLGQVVAR